MIFINFFVLAAIVAVSKASNRTELRSIKLSFCPDFGVLDHGIIIMHNTSSGQSLHFQCDEGYDLIGKAKMLCNGIRDENVRKPECAKRCGLPPKIRNAYWHVSGMQENQETFRRGTQAIYRCENHFHLEPISGKIRECIDGIWTGIQPTCVANGCSPLSRIQNGYFALEPKIDLGYESVKVQVGRRAHFSCREGYSLEGPGILQCIETGVWSPRQQPQCIEIQESITTNVTPNACNVLPSPPHATLIAAGPEKDSYTSVEIHCVDGYRDSVLGCEPSILLCKDGQWEGTLPHCVPVTGCAAPPSIPEGALFGESPDGTYRYGAEVAYTCLPGYLLRGNSILTCSKTGCWTPHSLPSCHIDPHIYDVGAESARAWGMLLVSLCTAAGVTLVLLAACALVLCRRRPRRRHHHHHHHHHHRPPPPVQHETLTPTPDRVALIAYADPDALLPSYEESIRERAGLPNNSLFPHRTMRAHWTPLTAPRRPRDPGHVTRQSSNTSHSAGDSMGSTDTMTASEVSTNITLDTVSSHTYSSSSQTASCRAISGSLASFDTSSVVNTEGVPLLEECELEEGGIADRGQQSENTSFKYRHASPEPV